MHLHLAYDGSNNLVDFFVHENQITDSATLLTHFKHSEIRNDTLVRIIELKGRRLTASYLRNHLESDRIPRAFIMDLLDLGQRLLKDAAVMTIRK